MTFFMVVAIRTATVRIAIRLKYCISLFSRQVMVRVTVRVRVITIINYYNNGRPG